MFLQILHIRSADSQASASIVWVDGSAASVGTENMDSLEFHAEIRLVVNGDRPGWPRVPREFGETPRKLLAAIDNYTDTRQR